MPEATVLKDDEEVLKTLQEGNFKPRESVLITERENEKVKNDSVRNGEDSPLEEYTTYEKILKYSSNCVEIATQGNDSSFLVLADNYYPGWKVYVNGIEKNILRVNYNLRGVIVPRGQNKVKFSYDPLSFKIEASISLMTLISSIVFFLMQGRVKHIGS